MLKAALIPRDAVITQATFVPRTNSHRFLLRDAIWKLSTVQDVSDELRAVVY